MSDRVDRMLNAAMARAINGDGLVRASNVVGKLCDQIERLQKNVEYHKGLAGALLRKEDDTWDEALLKAAGLVMKGPEEGGVAKSLAFFAKAEDHWVYKQACLDYARAILELKRS